MESASPQKSPATPQKRDPQPQETPAAGEYMQSPSPVGILQLQRLIGNQMTIQVLNNQAAAIQRSDDRQPYARTRHFEVDVPERVTYDQLLEIMRQHAAMQRFLIAESDRGAHIEEILRDHSNLRAAHGRIAAVGASGALGMDIEYHYVPIEGPEGYRVERIEITMPGVADPQPAETPPAESSAGTEEPASEADRLRAAREYYRMISRYLLRGLYAELLPDGEHDFTVADDDLIRAIMQRQRAEGMADPDGILPLPQIHQIVDFGLEREEQREAYIEYSDANVEAVWDTLTTAEDRMQHIMGGINSRLAAIGVPGCGWEEQPLAANVGAYFDSVDWRIYFNSTYIQRADLMQYLIESAYHEARHAEQNFLAIRYMVVNAVLVQGIRQLLGSINSAAVARAQAAGPLSGMELVMAREFYTEYLLNADVTEGVEAARDEAYADLIEAQTSGNEDAIREAEAEYRRADRAYHGLVGEGDAYRVQGALSQDYREEHAVEDASVETPGTVL